MKNRYLAVALLTLLTLPGAAGAEMRGEGAQHGAHWAWYHVTSADQGRRELNMGQHTLCALSAYQQGGQDGFCSVGQTYGDWILVAIDQDDPGRPQKCVAVCLDMAGHGIAGTPHGGGVVPPSPPSPPDAGLVSLAGKWAAYRGGAKVADCSIQQEGNRLTFIMHRNPVERSSGQLLGNSRLEATDWGNQKGTLSANGRRIDWGNSYWLRVD